MENSIIRKIKLLLNKTKNNPSQEEAQAALLMAQRIMAEHGISQSEVSDYEDRPVEAKKVIKDYSGWERLPWWKKQIARVVADNFRCHSFISRRSDGRSSVAFLGLEQDVELAKMTHEFACDAIKYGAKRYTREPGCSNARVKNDYMFGWIAGLEAQYKAQVAKNDWGLVLMKDALVEKEYSDMNPRKGRAGSVRTSGSRSARDAGYQDGKSFSSPSGRLQEV